MTKVTCADNSCAYWKDDKCTADKISLSWHSVQTVYGGRENFSKCKAYKESERYKELLRMLPETMRGDGIDDER